MKKILFAVLAIAGIGSQAHATIGPVISYVKLSTGPQQSGGFNTSTGTVGSFRVSSNTVLSGATFYQNAQVIFSTNVYFNPTTMGIMGTTTNDSPVTGAVGESTSSFQTSMNCAATTNWTDMGSLLLSPGDWDVAVTVYSFNAGATWTEVDLGASTTSGNSSGAMVQGDSWNTGQWGSSSTTPVVFALTIPAIRFSLAAPTRVYEKLNCTFSAGTPNARGRISARRVR